MTILCSYSSGSMVYTPDPDKCGVDYDCRLKVHIEFIKFVNGHYEVYGMIHNTGTVSANINFSSGNNSGTYLPAGPVPVAPGATYDFMQTPLLFYPAPGFAGGPDSLLVTGINCTEKIEMNFPYGEVLTRAIVNTSTPEVKVIPNPAKQLATIRYNTGSKDRKASSIIIYDAMGTVRFKSAASGSSGEVEVDVTQWVQGVYIVTVVTGDQPLQAKLLKE